MTDARRGLNARLGRTTLVCVGALGMLLSGCAGVPGRPKPATLTAPSPQAPETVVRMAPIPNPEPERASHPARPSVARHASPAKAAETPPADHAPPAVDHAQAAHLRARGLEELNRGNIDHALNLLQSAARLDPDNALIRRDLERAERISRAVHSRH